MSDVTLFYSRPSEALTTESHNTTFRIYVLTICKIIKKVSKPFHTNVSDMTLFFFNLPSEALANSHNATVRMYVSFS